MIYYLDLDDFCDDNNSLDLLVNLKKEIPSFKVNLFTIIGRCSNDFLTYVKTELPWADLIPHGFLHLTSRECEDWDFKKSISYLDYIKQFNLTAGFKAPGWMISDAMYLALYRERYFVADQIYNNKRRPMALKSYLLDSPNKIHGHIGHMGGYNANELSLIIPEIMQHKDKEFGFIRDTV
jgi:hypothetical protein